ncbi:cation:proton antiporter [Alicyclobacillus herbarius]|uniref:cation:proton antiporter domain-containing protein n=1 Tax=Alicyclobacillus herbarius TaxID=122960 RepID=UPI00041F9344|nr:cation:proton antiporter [Alicyclobacillus herbarius]
MLIFVLLGTQVDFRLVAQHLWMSLILIGIFIAIARPLAVLASVLVDRKAKWDRKHILFMFWVRETGVIPAALSGVLIAQGVPDAHLIASVTFMAILITILVQASTTELVAKRLQVLKEYEEV